MRGLILTLKTLLHQGHGIHRNLHSFPTRRSSDLATGADYFRTRAGAIEALGELPAASTAAPLEAALRDTSAQVRRAAIAALGQRGGARPAELARATFQTDPSYEVRAAALTALVHADSTARDSAVAWGLATPSYQDVIQEAAYRIIAQTRDTAAIPRVEERLATDRLAAHVRSEEHT